MPKSSRPTEPTPWEPYRDPEGFFSSGIPDLDRLLGGGYRRGSFALFTLDGTVTLEDLHLLFTPTWANFLLQSRGIVAVLPAQESPAAFRRVLLKWVSRRLFDSRVRIVDYVGEDDDAPYVASLKGVAGRGAGSKKNVEAAMKTMQSVERAVQGARRRPFLEYNALEIMESIAGAEKATRMALFGVKRARQVGNLGLAMARPGLEIFQAARSMMDYEMSLGRSEIGLVVAGVRPRFSAHVVIVDRSRGPPHVALVPSPPVG